MQAAEPEPLWLLPKAERERRGHSGQDAGDRPSVSPVPVFREVPVIWLIAPDRHRRGPSSGLASGLASGTKDGSRDDLQPSGPSQTHPQHPVFADLPAKGRLTGPIRFGARAYPLLGSKRLPTLGRHHRLGHAKALGWRRSNTRSRPLSGKYPHRAPMANLDASGDLSPRGPIRRPSSARRQ